MKKFIVFLTFVLVASLGQDVWAQTRQEKKQMSHIEREISRLESQLKDLQKDLEKEKASELYELKRELKEVEQMADPSQNEDFDSVAEAQARKEEILDEIEDVEAISSSMAIDIKREEIGRMEEERQKIIQAWIRPSHSIPREMTAVTRNRRQNSNVARREDLVLSKIEENINQAVSPACSEGGYKVIFDNKYNLNTTFILKGLDGGQRLAISMAPKTKERHNILPGKYLVEYYVSGHRMNSLDRLTIDGEIHYYESEPCFGFVAKQRY